MATITDDLYLQLQDGDILSGRQEISQYRISFAGPAVGFPDSEVTASAISASLTQMAVINYDSSSLVSGNGVNMSGFDTEQRVFYSTIAKSFFDKLEKDAYGHIYCSGNVTSGATAANIIYIGFAKQMILDSIYPDTDFTLSFSGGISVSGNIGLYSSTSITGSQYINIVDSSNYTVGKLIPSAGICILYGYNQSSTNNPLYKIISSTASKESVISFLNNSIPSTSGISLTSFTMNASQKKYKNIYYCDMPFDNFNQSNNPTWWLNTDILNDPRSFVCYIGLYGEEIQNGVTSKVLYAIAGLGYPLKKTPLKRPSFAIEISV